jgi:hypothetical protein
MPGCVKREGLRCLNNLGTIVWRGDYIGESIFVKGEQRYENAETVYGTGEVRDCPGSLEERREQGGAVSAKRDLAHELGYMD